MPVEALLLPLRMPLFCSFEIIALVGCGIQVELFVRKNKDDKVSKEFYYLGHMTASGNTKEFTMTNTEKTAVEIEWILDVPVREDIYEYIVNS